MKSIFDLLPQINASTAEEMAKQAGLDFTAVKKELHYKYTKKTDAPTKGKLVLRAPPSGPPPTKDKEVELTVPDMVAVVREDDGRYLGTVGKNRGILQYRDVLAFTESLVTAGEAAYVTGGVIGNGEQAFVVMKTGKVFSLSGTDTIDCFFYPAAVPKLDASRLRHSEYSSIGVPQKL